MKRIAFIFVTIVLIVTFHESIGESSAESESLTIPKRDELTSVYCNLKSCRGRSHIACNNKGKFGKACARTAKSVMNKGIQTEIVDKHNRLRDKVASGRLPGYKPAVRMVTMVWDEELAKLADLLAKTCVMKHDKCRNTERYDWVGQNIAESSWKNERKDEEQLVLELIDDWFNEYTNGTMDTIDEYETETGIIMGHFTQIVQDKSNSIGCAMVLDKDGQWDRALLVCNYARTNMIGESVYKDGKSASKCKTGRNHEYTSLCSMGEVIDPNSLD